MTFSYAIVKGFLSWKKSCKTLSIILASFENCFRKIIQKLWKIPMRVFKLGKKRRAKVTSACKINVFFNKKIFILGILVKYRKYSLKGTCHYNPLEGRCRSVASHWNCGMPPFKRILVIRTCSYTWILVMLQG